MPSSHTLHPSSLLCIQCLFPVEVLASNEAPFIHTTNFHSTWADPQREVEATFSQAAIGFVAGARSRCAPQNTVLAVTVTVSGLQRPAPSNVGGFFLTLRSCTRADSHLDT